MGERTVLLTGAAGFVGQALWSILRQNNIKVRSQVRSLPRSPIIDPSVIGLDFNYNTDWSDALAGVDTVLHIASISVPESNWSEHETERAFDEINVRSTKNLILQAANSGVSKFVYLSSAKVYGDRSICGDYLSETSPLRPHGAYARSKFSAELIVEEIASKYGIDYAIVRSPMVYGRDARGNFKTLIQSLRARVPLVIGTPGNLRSFISVQNLVDFLCRVVTEKNKISATFNVSDGLDLSSEQLFKMVASELGVNPFIIRIPKSVLSPFFKVLGREKLAESLFDNLELDIALARQRFDWTPPFSVNECLRNCVE